jgi:hypothetical protein
MFIILGIVPPSGLGDFYFAFLSILFEGIPYIVLGTLFSAMIDAFLPAKTLERYLPRHGLLATLVAGALGLIFPLCECAIVPVIRRLVGKGLPLSCGVAYMLASPIVNPVVALSTMTAFGEGWQALDLSSVFGATMTWSRLTLGYLMACFFGLLALKLGVKRLLHRDMVAQLAVAAGASEKIKSRSFDEKLVNGMNAAMRDFLDTTIYFVVGVMVTAFFNTQINQANYQSLADQAWTANSSMMVLGMVLSLCSTSDAFVVAPMAAFSQASKLAFLVFGPVMDLKLLLMYATLFRKRVIVSFGLLLFIILNLCVDRYYEWVVAILKFLLEWK